jgi:hypothetical protein
MIVVVLDDPMESETLCHIKNRAILVQCYYHHYYYYSYYYYYCESDDDDDDDLLMLASHQLIQSS